MVHEPHRCAKEEVLDGVVGRDFSQRVDVLSRKATFGFAKEEVLDGVVGRADFLHIRAFLPLGAMQRVLALRALLVSSSPADGNRVPFFMQPTLGGGSTLRGYDSYRFRGEDLMLYQLEYRWEANPLAELALFVDAGTVSEPGGSLSFDDLKTDWGVGLRFKMSRSVILRIDQAWSNETSRTHFRVDAVF